MRIILFLMVLTTGVNLAFAKTVTLKTGVILEGEIIEKTDNFIILRTEKGGKYKLRFDQIENAETIDVVASSVDLENDFEKNFQFGVTHFSKNEFKEAIQYFEKAQLLEPDNSDVLMNLSTLNFMMGNNETAVKQLKKMLEINPDDFNANLALGSHFFKNQQNQAALPYLEKCLKIDPMADASYYLLAGVYIHLADNTKALAYLQNGLKVKPNSSELYRHLAAFYKNSLKDPRRALPFAKRAVELKENSEAYYLLGEIYLELDQTNDATAALQKAKEIKP